MNIPLMIAAALAHDQRMRKPPLPTIKVVAHPTKTRNRFGPIEEIAGKELELIERNKQGDCLCIFTGRLGKNLVDVWACDVEATKP